MSKHASRIKPLLAIALALSAWAGVANAEKAFEVSRIPAPGGEVVFANPDERELMYDQFGYSAARRAGDFVYLSGVEAGPLVPGEGTDVEAFKLQLRRAFTAIRNSLAATGATMQDVVALETFHNCKTPSFTGGDFTAQLTAMIAVKAEFFTPPYSTWTALCVDRHYSDNTVVEIKVTAYAPQKKKKR